MIIEDDSFALDMPTRVEMLQQHARLAGNAVPPLAGQKVIEAMRERNQPAGSVLCVLQQRMLRLDVLSTQCEKFASSSPMTRAYE